MALSLVAEIDMTTPPDMGAAWYTKWLKDAVGHDHLDALAHMPHLALEDGSAEEDDVAPDENWLGRMVASFGTCVRQLFFDWAAIPSKMWRPCQP